MWNRFITYYVLKSQTADDFSLCSSVFFMPSDHSTTSKKHYYTVEGSKKTLRQIDYGVQGGTEMHVVEEERNILDTSFIVLGLKPENITICFPNYLI